MSHTRTVTVGKTSSTKSTGSQAAERARITEAARAQRERAARLGVRTGQVSRGGRVIRPVGGAPAQTPKPPPPTPVVKPTATSSALSVKPTQPPKAQLILSRKDGSRIITGSNVVNQGDTITVYVISAPPAVTCRLKYGNVERNLTTSRSGTASTSITMNQSGNIGVNVLVPSGRKTASGAIIYDTYFEAVWVQAKAAPALPQQEVPVNQTVTQTTAQQVTTPSGPSFIDQLGQAGEQAKVGFGGFGVGVLAAGILGVILLLRKPGRK